MSSAEEPERRPELRIGDLEREQAVTHLGRAFAEGRLELHEYDERVASAYGAKTASELLHLTADLPLATREVGAAGTVSGTAPLATPRLRSGRPARSSGAEFLSGLPGPLRAAWWTYAAAVSINLVVWLIVGVGEGEIAYFWPIWVAGPWGVILLFSTLAYRSGPGSRRR